MVRSKFLGGRPTRVDRLPSRTFAGWAQQTNLLGVKGPTKPKVNQDRIFITVRWLTASWRAFFRRFVFRACVCYALLVFRSSVGGGLYANF